MKYIAALFLICISVFAESPNVILIVADDLGSQGLACFGGKYLETPNLDRLCKEGMKFTDGLACYPTCKPSRAALLSGQYGPRTGVYRVSDKHKGFENLVKYKVPENGILGHDKVIISEVFKKAGYTTAMFGKWHVSNNSEGHPVKHGFDEAIVSAGAHYKFTSFPEVKVEDDISSAEIFTEKANDFMTRSVKAKKPFFLYMPYFLVHRPLETKKEYVEHFKKKMAGKVEDEELPVLAAMTKLLDDCCGSLLDKVKSLGIEENTLVIFTSDNGSFKPLYNGELRGQKGDTYEGGLQIPYIFKWPGKINAGSVCGQRIGGVDLYPTLLGILNLKTEQPLDGISLLSLLTGQKKELPERPLVCFFPKYARINKKTNRWVMSWRNVLYEGDWKLIEYPEYDEYELFNLKTDKLESNNLSDSKPELKLTMKKKLHSILKDIKAPELRLNPDYQINK